MALVFDVMVAGLDVLEAHPIRVTDKHMATVDLEHHSLTFTTVVPLQFIDWLLCCVDVHRYLSHHVSCDSLIALDMLWCCSLAMNDSANASTGSGVVAMPDILPLLRQ